jgi:dienelactone hydrolase
MRRIAPFSLLTLALIAALAIGCRAQEPAAQPSLREEFRKLVLADRRPCELKPQPIAQTSVGNVQVERVRFTPEPGHDAVALIYRPQAEGKRPAVIVQHFLGGSKDHILFAPLLNNLAQKGFVAVAIDGRYRGERQNGKSLEAAMVEALRTGKGRPFLLDTAYDITRLLDYLETRPDVDATKIGMTGFSEGGILTWMCAVLDDRIKAAAPIIGVTCFGETLSAAEGPEVQARVRLFDAVLKEYAMDLGETQVNGKVLRAAWDKLVPGMLDRFDAPRMVPLIAPRPLLIHCHEQDEIFPLAGAQKVFAAAKARYAEQKAEDRIDFRVSPGFKHAQLNLTAISGMVEWMERWLK